MKQRYRALRGTKDILPEETERWLLVERTVRDMFTRYGFDEIRTPVIEATELFARSVGASSDIVRKEMYTFGAGEESVCLRPENTASVVRAFVEHSLHRRVASGYPERYFYMGPMFRHERPQKGRQRQFHQIGVEVLGAEEALADAETIQMADALLGALGVGERELLINSVGDAECRPRYRELLREWLAPRLGELCADCNRRSAENPLRVFDCKVEADRTLLRDAPRIGDSLCSACEDHFGEVRRALDAYGVAYRVESDIVRGLDYYVRTVFEIVSAGLGAQNAILGGGRYDGLVEELGGPAIPGFGFAMGTERLILLMPAPDPAAAAGCDLALISLGRDGWEAAVLMAQRLRAAGVSCMTPISERPMGAQMRRADRVGARFALFVGADELAAGRFGLKNLRTGEQVDVSEDVVAPRVKEGNG
jgi:histidyl-tRNA synthetase